MKQLTVNGRAILENSLAACLGVRLLGHMVAACLVFKEMPFILI